MPFSEYNILFGDKDDRRIDHFLHTVQHIQDKVFKKEMPVYDLFTSSTPVFRGELEKNEFMQNGLFDDKIRSEPRMNIHPRWLVIMFDIIIYIHTQTNKDNVLKVLNKLRKERSSSLSDTTLIRRIVNALYQVHSKGSIIEFNRDTDDIDNYELNPNILGNLFGSGISNTSLPSILSSNPPITMSSTTYSSYITFGDAVRVALETYGVRSGEKEAEYKMDEYIVNLSSSTNIDEISTDFWIEDEVSVKQYFRDNTGKLYRLKNGKREYIDDVSYLKSLNEGRCKAAGLDPSNSKSECTKYITQCLSGEDFKKCQEYLNNKKTLIFLPDEVKNMPPQLIEKTIKALNIRKKRDVDPETKISIDVLVSYEEWLSDLRGKMDSKEIDNIKNHDTLSRYIQLLISHVNTQPAILNKDYVNNNNNSERRINPKFYEGTNLYKMGLRPNFPHNYIFPTGAVTLSDIEILHNSIIDERTMFLNDIMVGGGPLNFEEMYNNPPKQMNQLFKQYFINLQDMLKNQNKVITMGDQEKILKLLQSLENSEKNLLKAFNYINKYNRLLNSFGERSNVKNLTFDYLKKFVNERNTKYDKVTTRRLDIVSMFRALAEAANSP